MNVIFLMLAVMVCYTISSLSDKYAVSEAKFTGDEFTFLMCSSMSVFLAFTLPFQELRFTLTWQSFAAIFLIAACKMLEFQMSALVLKQLSAFELKAWLGVTLFVSYITDVLYGANLRVLKILCIAVTVVGLVFIAKSGRDGKIEYRKIAAPLVLYLSAKYGYGLVIKAFTPYISSTVQLLPALVIIAVIMLFRIKPSEIVKKNKQGSLTVILARIPNTAGMLLENAVIAISLANYSFIQPMILVSLFLIGILRKESHSKLNLIGSMICVAGVIMFQIL
ncbi:MAG: hypothetical protein J6K17_07090 [Oscillospiraceae bacterium]|nr:hypothetical protein [Oscillospiraceae bacterium]